MKLKALVGSADMIMRLVIPVLVIGLPLNLLLPGFFSVGGPPDWLMMVSVVMIAPGIAVWLWSVALILSRVPRGELITGGPYALVKHPLYTGVALLVLPWAGFLLNTWLGVAAGAALYAGCRLYAPAEEKKLADIFGPAWEAYAHRVKLAWL